MTAAFDASTVVRRPTRADLQRRLPSSILGMVVIGAAITVSVRADLGLAPWDVLHQGLAELTGLAFGPLVVLVGLVVLLAWIPLGQQLGIGTVINVFVVGPSVSVFDHWIPEVDGAPARVGLLALSIVLFGIGGGLYIGSALGPGPRDGLMTGLTARGFVLWKVRTVIEVSVLVLGWAFGGTVGVGTVVLAFALGPVTHVALGWFHIPVRGHEAEVLGE